MHTATTQKINSSRRCLSTTLTLSAAALSASAAHGAVVVTNFAASSAVDVYLSFNPTTGSATVSIIQPDVPNWVFAANTYFEVGGKSGWTGANATGNWAAVTMLAPSPLSPESTVDNTISWVTQITPLPSNLTDAYFGVRLRAVNETSTYQYGWVKLSTGPNAGGFGPTSITMHAAALETTPNTGITIPSAVPEPSSALLLGLALGAGAFSRRRSQAA